MSSSSERSGSRPRRTASRGAVVAVALCAVSALTVSADTSIASQRSAAGGTGQASTLVPITPCRLVDTRRGSDNVGGRAAPIGPGEVVELMVRGVNGNCSVPTTATAAAMNVTVIDPTAASFLTAFPTGEPVPLSANLNWVAGQAPTPNSVTVRLSAAGAFSLYNFAGQVDVTVDLVGFYEPASTGVARVISVAESGADFTTLSAALASITDNDAAHPYLITVAPGTYVEQQTVRLKDHVDVQGSGAGVTIVVCGCRDVGAVPDAAASAVLAIVGASRGAVSTEVRDLAVVNRASPAPSGGSGDATGIWASGARLSLRDVTVTAAATTGAATVGIAVSSADLAMDGVSVTAAGEGLDTAISAISSGITMTAVSATADGPVRTVGILLSASTFTLDGVTASATTRHVGEAHAPNDSTAVQDLSSSGTMRDVTATAVGGDTATAVRNDHSSPTMDDVIARATGSLSATAVHNDHASPVIDDLMATAQGTGAWTMHGEVRTIGVYNATSSPTIGESTVTAIGTGAPYIYGIYDDSSTVDIRDSAISGSSISIHNAGTGTVTLFGSLLSGTPTGAGYTCASDFVEGTLLPVTCPA